MITQNRPRRKASGGRYRSYRKKRLYEAGNLPTDTKLGNFKTKTTKGKYALYKTRVVSTDKVNVALKDGKSKVVKIESILENPANREYVRRNIITKGAIVKTELGKVKITSRPGQDGTVNGILIE